jgi:D-glycero-D-manno-heptose 1,7-bisphosphate phosphatase
MDYQFAIFDVDGTLTEITPEVLAKNPKMVTPNKLGQQRPKPRVVEKLAELKEAGIQMAIATNRGGVAWGFQKLKVAENITREAIKLCGIPEAAVYLCPYHAKARGFQRNKQYARDDECRKPRPGMLLQAMDEAGFGPEETIFVGDYETDEQAAENAGVRFFWAEDFFNW